MSIHNTVHLQESARLSTKFILHFKDDVNIRKNTYLCGLGSWKPFLYDETSGLKIKGNLEHTHTVNWSYTYMQVVSLYGVETLLLLLKYP